MHKVSSPLLSLKEVTKTTVRANREALTPQSLPPTTVAASIGSSTALSSPPPLACSTIANTRYSFEFQLASPTTSELFGQLLCGQMMLFSFTTISLCKRTIDLNFIQPVTGLMDLLLFSEISLELFSGDPLSACLRNYSQCSGVGRQHLQFNLQLSSLSLSLSAPTVTSSSSGRVVLHLTAFILHLLRCAVSEHSRCVRIVQQVSCQILTLC